jgi:uncharacterized surface protein with fasciclin (FAS1) repeats
MHFRSVASDAPHLHSFSAPGISLPSTTAIAALPLSIGTPSHHATPCRSLHREQRMNTPNTPQTNTAQKTGNVAQSAAPGTIQSRNLLDTAAAKGSFGTFAKAVAQAGLSETLNGAGPFTVFAPTDAAFAKLPAGKLDALMKSENKDELASILKYHVLSGRKSVADMGKWDTAKTVNGQSAPIRMLEGKFSIDGAHITDSDIGSSNGVIHGIDKVNLPAVAAVL